MTALALVVVAALAAQGCGGVSTPPVTRRLAGEEVTGVFVSPYSYEHYVRGEIAIASGDLETAVAELTLARAGPEEDPLVLGRLAETLETLGRREEADAVLEEAHDRFEDAESVWLATARIAVRRDDDEAAMAAYEHAEQVAPESSLAPLELSRLLRERGATSRAEAVLVRFRRRAGPTSAEALRAEVDLAVTRGDAEGSARAIARLLRVAPVRAESIVSAAQAALRDGRPALAARLLDAVPEGQAPALLRFEALVASGRGESAEGVIATARDEDIGGPLGRARLLVRIGRVEQAIAIADAEALREPTPEAWLVAGLARLAAGRRAEGATWLARVPPDARGAAEARRALADALTGEGLDGLAAELLAGEVARTPEDATRAALAELRFTRGATAAAVTAWDGATGPTALAAQASALERAGRPTDALALWARVTPDVAGLPREIALRAGAERHLAARRPREGIAALQSLVALAPDDAIAAARLAEVLAEAGRAADARAVATRALPLAAEPAARDRLARLAR